MVSCLRKEIHFFMRLILHCVTYDLNFSKSSYYFQHQKQIQLAMGKRNKQNFSRRKSRYNAHLHFRQIQNKLPEFDDQHTNCNNTQQDTTTPYFVSLLFVSGAKLNNLITKTGNYHKRAQQTTTNHHKTPAKDYKPPANDHKLPANDLESAANYLKPQTNDPKAPANNYKRP